MMMHRLANFKFTQVSISKVCNMLESYNKSVIDYGMDSQCTSLGEDIVGWTVSVQVSERTLWYGQPVYSLGEDTATSVLTSAFKVKLAYTQLVLLGRMLPIK